jgi:putative ABC transport system ATP-binding protein
VGIVFQHLALVPDLSVAENLLLPMIPRTIAWPRMQKEILRRLSDAGLTALSDAPTSTLSGGQRQRLAIARALVARPRFILADEPTAFQDDLHATQIFAQLCNAARKDAVVVICSHDPRLRSSADVDRRFHLVSARLTAHAANQDSP